MYSTSKMISTSALFHISTAPGFLILSQARETRQDFNKKIRDLGDIEIDGNAMFLSKYLLFGWSKLMNNLDVRSFAVSCAESVCGSPRLQDARYMKLNPPTFRMKQSVSY